MKGVAEAQRGSSDLSKSLSRAPGRPSFRYHRNPRDRRESTRHEARCCPLTNRWALARSMMLSMVGGESGAGHFDVACLSRGQAVSTLLSHPPTTERPPSGTNRPDLILFVPEVHVISHQSIHRLLFEHLFVAAGPSDSLGLPLSAWPFIPFLIGIPSGARPRPSERFK